MTREEKIKAIIADTDKNYAPYYDVLPNLIKERGYKSGIEIGVFCGGHAEKILQTGCSLIGIDPYMDYTPGMPLLDNQEDWDMNKKKRNKLIQKIADEVQKEYGMGGLSDGIYFDFAKDVAIRFQKIYFKSLTNEKRLKIMSNYCHYCGKDETKERCYCAPIYDE